MTDRAAIYARVSTDDQTIVTQLDPLERRARDLGLPIAQGQSYVDQGVSGRLDNRPDFDRLREAIRARAIDVVLVTKIDRLGRSARTILGVFDEAEAAGVRIIVLDGGIDTGTPVGRFTRTIVAGFAELEGDLIRERTQVAMDAIRTGSRKTRSGRPVGRPRRVTPEIVARIAELRAAGHRWNDTAQRVGLPAETCRKALWTAKRSPSAVQDSPTGNIPLGSGSEVPR